MSKSRSKKIAIAQAVDSVVSRGMILSWSTATVIFCGYLFSSTFTHISDLRDLISTEVKAVIADSINNQDHFAIQRELSRIVTSNDSVSGLPFKTSVYVESRLTADVQSKNFTSSNYLNHARVEEFTSLSGLRIKIESKISFVGILRTFIFVFTLFSLTFLLCFTFMRRRVAQKTQLILQSVKSHVNAVQKLALNVREVTAATTSQEDSDFLEMAQLSESSYALVSAIVEYREGLEKSQSETIQIIEQSSRERAIASVSRMLAHDVRQPFSVLKYGIEALGHAESMTSVRTVMSALQSQFNQSLDLAECLISDISTLGSVHSYDISRQNLKTIMHDATHGVFLRESTARLELKIDPHIFVLVDRIQFIRAVTNIIENAKDATMGMETSMIEINSAFQVGKLRLNISNNGPTIDQDSLPYIFDPDFTIKKRNGTGLGLAIAKKIITQHGSSIECTSHGGETTFSIWFNAKSFVKESLS